MCSDLNRDGRVERPPSDRACSYFCIPTGTIWLSMNCAQT